MKSGLLTVHNSVNYGASLQAYALFKTMKKFDEKAVILDYTPVKFADLLDNRKYSGLKNYIINKSKFILYKKQIVDKHNSFKSFSDKYLIPKTKVLNSVNNEIIEEEKLNMLICGSDQIWNPYNTNNDTNFFFKDTDNILKNSYAASIGLDDMSSIKMFLKNNLSDFTNISVREDKGVEFVRNLGYECSQVLDPVFLLNKQEWVDISIKPRNMINDKYLLLYALEDNDEYIKIVKDLAEKNKLKVVVIQAGLKKKFSGDLVYKTLGPEEFLYLFNNASYVVTNSFHGTAFSVLFEKEFVVFGNKGKNVRMDSLLRLLNLSNLMINNYDDYLNILNCKVNDYTKILDENIKKSLNYIKRMYGE